MGASRAGATGKYRGGHGTAWTLIEDLWLDRLWRQGWSARVIAFSLSLSQGRSRTKDMVIGRAHRLGLPKRPSPIIRRR